MERRRNLSDIPNDVIFEICYFLTSYDLCNLSLVSKKWDFSVISRSDRVWKKVCERSSKYDFLISDSTYYEKIFSELKTWKEKCLYLNSHIRTYQKIERLQIPNIVYPLYPRDFAGKKEQYYVHDNGGRPLMYEISEKTIQIFRINANVDYSVDVEVPKNYSKSVYKCEGWKKLFLGEGDTWRRESTEKMHVGNTILFETDKREEWVVYCFNLRKFRLSDDVKTILFYVSLVGRSDVPYPYFISDKYSVMVFNEMDLVDNNDLLFIPRDDDGEWVDRVVYFYNNMGKKSLVKGELKTEELVGRIF